MKGFGKRPKYGNKKVINEYGTFDSKREWERYKQLLLMEKEGLISNLQRQVPFIVIPAIYEDVEVKLKTKSKIVRKVVQSASKYIADFVYVEDGKVVVNDSKASYDFQDPVYRLKKRLMKYFHNIDIKETY